MLIAIAYYDNRHKIQRLCHFGAVLSVTFVEHNIIDICVMNKIIVIFNVSIC